MASTDGGPDLGTPSSAGAVPEVGGPPDGPSPPPVGRRSRRGPAIALIAVIVVIGGVAIWLAGRWTSPATVIPNLGPARADPLVALVTRDGALATVDAGGKTTVLGGEPGTTFGFPAWSPDGSRVAAVAYGPTDTAISIYPVPAHDGPSSPPPAPVVVYRSSQVPPFYLYWTPDGRRISFLATESDGISLRLAPADGSAPLDGGAGSVIRTGAPLYFEWIGSDRLMLHVGVGSEAFMGEVGVDGTSVAPAVTGSGDFRPAVVGATGRFVAFIRGQAPSASLVVAARDGSSEHVFPVSGSAAIVFDPTGSTVASIAAEDPALAPLAFPIGPLRLVDAASGVARTLVDGTVVGFFWSPDGKTMAVLRLQQGNGSTVAGGAIDADAVVSITAAGPSPGSAASPVLAASTGPAATPSTGPELHLLFVDVAGGAIRSDRVVQLSSHFVNEFLPYFDQYALSHRVWASDSSSLLLPLVDSGGVPQLVALQPDGSPSSLRFDGEVGFWSP